MSRKTSKVQRRNAQIPNQSTLRYKAHGNNKDPQTPGKKNGFQQLKSNRVENKYPRSKQLTNNTDA